MKIVWATGLMILTVLAGSALAGDGPCSPTRLWTDSNGQRCDMGYINDKPEYLAIPTLGTGTSGTRLVEISGKVLWICAGGTPRFNEVEYRHHREANP